MKGKHWENPICNVRCPVSLSATCTNELVERWAAGWMDLLTTIKLDVSDLISPSSQGNSFKSVCSFAACAMKLTTTTTAATTHRVLFFVLHASAGDYSEKACALLGDSRFLNANGSLTALGGKWNPKLTWEGKKQGGWIFSLKRRDAIAALLARSAPPGHEASAVGGSASAAAGGGGVAAAAQAPGAGVAAGSRAGGASNAAGRAAAGAVPLAADVPHPVEDKEAPPYVVAYPDERMVPGGRPGLVAVFGNWPLVEATLMAISRLVAPANRGEFRRLFPGRGYGIIFPASKGADVAEALAGRLAADAAARASRAAGSRKACPHGALPCWCPGAVVDAEFASANARADRSIVAQLQAQFGGGPDAVLRGSLVGTALAAPRRGAAAVTRRRESDDDIYLGDIVEYHDSASSRAKRSRDAA